MLQYENHKTGFLVPVLVAFLTHADYAEQQPIKPELLYYYLFISCRELQHIQALTLSFIICKLIYYDSVSKCPFKM